MHLTYALIDKILNEHDEYSCLGVVSHYPMRVLLDDMSFLTDDERRYASNPATHLDFLIYSHVTKKPVLAIETDGYSYHNAQTEQYNRDIKKNQILEKYAFPLLRLSTVGSGEEQKIIEALQKAYPIL